MGKIVILRATQYGLCYKGEELIAPGEIIDGISIIPDKKERANPPT